MDEITGLNLSSILPPNQLKAWHQANSVAENWSNPQESEVEILVAAISDLPYPQRDHAYSAVAIILDHLIQKTKTQN